MNQKINKSEQKKIIFNYLKNFFKQEEIKYINVWENRSEIYKEYGEACIYEGSFNFSNQGIVYYGNSLILKQVEKEIFEIENPGILFNLTKDTIGSYQNTFSTIQHQYSSFNEFKKRNFNGDFNNINDYIQFAGLIRHYIETDGQKFIDTYRYLPNVLIEMDKLETQGKSWKEVLCGGPEFLFRGLIISKLCNDPNYSQKKNFVDSRYEANPNLEKWQPYYEKLKTRLETLEPLYSMDSDGIYQPIPQPISPKTTTTEASSNLEIDNKTEIKNSDLIPETVIEIEHFDTVHLEKLNNFLSNIHKHTIEASQVRDDDMLNREELLYFQEIHRDQINKAIGDTPIHKAMKLERIEIFPNNTNEFAIYYYALDLGTFTTLAVNVTLSPEGWVEDSRMIVD